MSSSSLLGDLQILLAGGLYSIVHSFGLLFSHSFYIQDLEGFPEVVFDSLTLCRQDTNNHV